MAAAIKSVRSACTKHLQEHRSSGCQHPEDLKFSCDQLFASGSFEQLHELYQEEYCRVAEGPLGNLWGSYIEMVQLLLRFIRSSREGDWDLHVACLRDMMPWFFAYDRTNYSRYQSIYWYEMVQLKDRHPAAYIDMKNGQINVYARIG